MATRGALAYARRHRPRFLAELKDFIRFPTVSSQPAHAGDSKKCAAWLAGHLRRIGLDGVRVVPTPGNPIVYAEWQRAPGAPTVLVYGHYDVLPADPLQEWRTPPFEPEVRGSDLYGTEVEFKGGAGRPGWRRKPKILGRTAAGRSGQKRKRTIRTEGNRKGHQGRKPERNRKEEPEGWSKAQAGD